MRVPAVIISLLLSLSGFSQQELPEANRIVLEYSKSKIGQKVGKGICFNLIDSALCLVNHRWKDASKNMDEYVYGKRIKREEVLPGDIIVIDNGAVQSGHIAIIVSIGKDMLLNVIDQNGNGNLRDSKVEYDQISAVVYSKRELKYKINGYSRNQLKFYRPVI